MQFLNNPQKKKQALLLRLGLVLHLQHIITTHKQCNATSGIQSRCKQGFHIHRLNNKPLNSSTYVSLLQACIRKNALREGNSIHAHINKMGFTRETILSNTLVNMYAKCGSMVDARRIFDQLIERNVCSWTVMISAYASHGFPEEALILFHQMQKTGLHPNHFTFASVLPACASLASLEHGMKIHQQINQRGFQSNVFVISALVNMYAKCRSIEKARELFDKMHERDSVLWNTMIAGYVHNGRVYDAHRLFMQMPERNTSSWNAVVSGFAQNGLVDDAYKLFQKIPQRDVFSWTAMISGFAQNGLVDEALKLFNQMPQQTLVSWNVMIAGYAQNGFVDKALDLFQKTPRRDVFTWTAMISGFAQNGFVDKALILFNQMPQRTVVSWNAMIAGFMQNGHSQEALKLFHEMQLAGERPDCKTYTSILPACANLTALQKGMDIHEKIVRNGFQSDVIVVNALIDMYGKCGSIQKARELFNSMHQRDIVSWTTMIGVYALHGFGKEALKLFKQMEQSGVYPNPITLVCVLFACSHAGLVDEGCYYFNCMRDHYHITPSVEHYSCMVDLLGRIGHLDEAHNLIKRMPIKPDAVIWSCLLSACRMHNNIELGEYVVECILELDSKNSAPYILLSNIYAAAGRWDDIGNIRKMMKDKEVNRIPGCSWIEINKQVHSFHIGDKSQSEIQTMNAKLNGLSWEMNVVGYVPEIYAE